MDDIKSVIAENIVELRHSKKWTQAEMADKLNYTDKAISKWERAESMPDIGILKRIADIFGVTLDYFVHKNAREQKEKYLLPQKVRNNRIIITSMFVLSVWLLATIVFVYTSITVSEDAWIVFVWSIPASSIVLLVANIYWGKQKFTFYIISLLVWSAITCFYLQFIDYNMWLIFLLGLPVQALIILWGILKLK